jgi:hypothetical protein
MRNALEGMCSYLTSATAFFVSINWGGVGSAFLLFGSIVLLLMRLYVEYHNFKDKRKDLKDNEDRHTPDGEPA